eukprot:COSAG05_NODE_1292_length_5262_cov_2.550068_1_plen_249_part_10
MNFVPDDSYLVEFFSDREKFGGAYDYPVEIYFQADAGLATGTNFAQLSALEDVLESSVWIDGGSVESWFSVFCNYSASINASSCSTTSLVSDAAFAASVTSWLSTPSGMRYTGDIKVVSGKVTSCRLHAIYAPNKVTTSDGMVDAMQLLRSEVAAVAPSAFPFTYQYMFWEQFAVVKDELFTNIMLSLACVLFITAVLTAHPGMALLICSMVGITLVSMGGIDRLVGQDIDAIGMVCFAFAVGISVDYS